MTFNDKIRDEKLQYDINRVTAKIMKILNRRELQEIAYSHSFDIDCDEFKRLYRKCTAEPYLFLITDTTFPSDNPSRFQKNLL